MLPKIQQISQKPKIVFLVFFALFGLQVLAWAIGTPLLSASDEPAHIMTAAADARGQIVKQQVEAGKSPFAKVQIAKTYANTGSESFCYSLPTRPPACRIPKSQCVTAEATGKLPCGLELYSNSQTVDTITYTGNYPPLYYTIVGTPSLISSKVQTIYFMRFISAIVAAVLIGLAYYAVYKWSARPLMYAGLSLALAPTVVYLMGSVNPSSWQLASIISLWATGLILVNENFSKIPRQLLAIILASALILVLTRSDGPVWCIIILATLAFMSKFKTLQDLAKNRFNIYSAVVLAAVFILAMAWILTQHASAVLPSKPYPESASMLSIAKSVISDMGFYIHQMFGLVGWNNVSIPLVTLMIWFASMGCVLLLSISSANKQNWRKITSIISMLALVVLLPVIYNLVYAHKYGNIVQGRYMLPAAIGAILIAASLAGENIKNSLPLTRLVCVLAAIGNVSAYFWVIRQYTGGFRAFNIFGSNTSWHPPVPALLLLITYTAANAGIVWLALALSAQRSSD